MPDGAYSPLPISAIFYFMKIHKKRFKKGNIPWNKGIQWSNPKRKTGEDKNCQYCGKEFHAPKWLLERGRGKFCTHKCYANSKLGKRPWNFKGVSPLRDRVRRNKKYKDWHSNILTRDNYTCQICKIRGGKLQVDHIKPFALFPKLRYSISNGQTLCIKCHSIKTAKDWVNYPMWHNGIYD